MVESTGSRAFGSPDLCFFPHQWGILIAQGPRDDTQRLPGVVSATRGVPNGIGCHLVLTAQHQESSTRRESTETHPGPCLGYTGGH